MRIIRKRVIVFGICALPSQRNAVGVAAVPINKACVRIDSAGIAHAHGTVGVAAVKALVAVYLCAVVDLTEAVCRYLDRHLLPGRLLRIAYGKFAAVHVPSVYKLRAFLILVEIYNYIVTVICDAAREIIHEGVAAQIACRRRDCRQGGNKLVFHNIAGRSAGAMRIAVCDVNCAAVILAGV